MIQLGSLNMDPATIGSQGNAILGIRGSGKTFTGTWLAERLFDAGIPFVAFDPIGVWRWLRVPGAGKGYPVVVAGGSDGDLPLTVASAPEIVRAAMASGVSLVIDLFDIELSKADWKRIVMSCVRVLLHENSKHGLRHIFIEEAAEFAPQKVGPDQGQVYAEIEKLARMGGNSRLGYTLINQRAEEVNKAVLELCDNLFLHRQKGRNSLTALSKWLDIGNAENAKEIVASMATLPTGQCWAWLGEQSAPVLVTIPAKNSAHPDRTVMRGDAEIKAKKAVDVGAFVASMKAALEKAAAPAPKSKTAPTVVLTKPDPDALEAEYHRGYIAGGTAAREVFVAELGAMRRRIGVAPLMLPNGKVGKSAPVAPRQVERLPPADTSASPMGAERRPLAVLASNYPAGYTEAQWASLAGFKRTGGTWGTYKSRLRTAGRIEERGGLWFATAAGVADCGDDVQRPPEPGPALVKFWGSRVSGAKRMLATLSETFPRMVTKQELAMSLDMEPTGGTFGTYLSRLRSNGLIEEVAGGLRVAPAIMGAA